MPPSEPSHPLAGQRVLLTRATEQADNLSAQLRAAGAEPLVVPTIAFAPPEDWTPLDRCLGSLPTFDWIALTSPNGARFFHERLRERGLDWPSTAHIAAVGEGTAAALRELGATVSLLARQADGEGLARALTATGPLDGRRILLPRGDLAASLLPDALREAGAIVADVVCYRNLPDPQAPEALRAVFGAAKPQWAAFASGSAFSRLLDALPNAPEALAGVRLASIGPRTSAVIREAGFHVDAEAITPDAAALTEAIVRAARPPA